MMRETRDGGFFELSRSVVSIGFRVLCLFDSEMFVHPSKVEISHFCNIPKTHPI